MGCPITLSHAEEKLIVDVMCYFANKNTPLTKSSVRDLVVHYVGMLPHHEQKGINFVINLPSNMSVDSFRDPHKLTYKSVRAIENKHVGSVTKKHVAEHIARVQEAMDRFGIHDARFVLNMGQCGSSFEKMVDRSMPKGIGSRSQKLIHATVRTKGSLDRTTLMAVVSAAGVAYKTLIVFSRKQAHFRRAKSVVQTLHTFLPPCYLYQREMPGVNEDIIYDWATNFAKETEELRQNNQKILLVLDGYGSHMQFKTLNFFKDNGIIVITMPSHASHVLQPSTCL